MRTSLPQKSLIRRRLGWAKWIVLDGGWRAYRYELKLAALEHSAKRKLAALPPIQCGNSGDEAIHVMAGQKHCTMASFALWSFLSIDKTDIGISIISDGTLREKERTHFNRLFPGCRIVESHESDRRFQDTLPQRTFPNLHLLREKNVFGKKIIDLHLSAQAKAIAIVDSDVLFFASQTPILHALQSARINQTVTCMKDILSGYPEPPDSISGLFSCNPPSRLNAGLIATQPFGIQDFELLEAILEKRPKWIEHYFVEQGLYSVYAGKKRWEYFPDDYIIPACDSDLTKANALGIHYAGPANRPLFYKHGLSRIVYRR